MSGDIQSAALMARRVETARGMMLGLALGDSWPDQGSAADLIPAGVGTQLACATVHGLICALERGGRALPPEYAHTTFTALHQWAAAQKLTGTLTGRDRVPPSWLATVPGYAQRRGSAPATVRALRHGQGAPLDGSNNSLGAHALVRTLPVGLLAATLGPPVLAEAAAIAATTHGHPLASLSAPVAASLVWAAEVSPDPIPQTLDRWLNEVIPEVAHTTDRIKTAVTAALVEPGDPDRLQALAPDRTAISALAGAVYCIASHPEPEALPQALDLAITARDARSTAAITGAVLGTFHRSASVIAAGAAQLELAWLATTLATDLAMELTLTPLGLQPDGTHWLTDWDQHYPIG